MRSHRVLAQVAVCLAIGALVVGCSRGPSEEELKLADLEQQFTSIQESYTALQQMRAELASAAQRVAEIEAVPEKRRTDEQQAELAELTARTGQLTADRESSFETLQTALADYLNVALNEFPDQPNTMAALTIYAEEAIGYANDAVAEAGDYKKAIDRLYGAASYYDAIGAEPYQPLMDHIQKLEDMRFIDRDRFDAITNGMTKQEVREIAGVPYYQNVKIDENKGVETWLYKRQDEGVAAIYFRMKTDKVYSKNYDAVKPRIVTG